MLETVDRLDNALLLNYLVDAISDMRNEAYSEMEGQVFKSKGKGKLEALNDVMTWIVDYKHGTQEDVDKIEEFIRLVFPNWFGGLKSISVSEGYKGLLTYQAVFQLPVVDKHGDVISEEEIARMKKDIFKAINGINEKCFPSGEYAIIAVIK